MFVKILLPLQTEQDRGALAREGFAEATRLRFKRFVTSRVVCSMYQVHSMGMMRLLCMPSILSPGLDPVFEHLSSRAVDHENHLDAKLLNLLVPWLVWAGQR